MATPATTGKLCTNLAGMNIGDYIAVKYTVPSGGTAGVFDFTTKGTISESNEIPVTGVSIPNGYFYFVKVAKGLLVADRNAQNGVSWDTLNAAKFIEGAPINGGNIIPAMTSYTEPSGLVQVSGNFNSSSLGWKAYDHKRSSSDSWSAAVGVPQWSSYTFTEPKIINAYAIGNNTGSGRTYDPKSWVFEGSNDNGNTWETLDTQTNIAYSGATELKKFTIANKKAFTTYRVKITQINGADHVNIFEIEMYESIGVIRSLTGGVAFADENGNKSLTDKKLGAWPTTNEWDTYIVNFPATLIQEGKTRDDVFHWSNCYTHCQDTIINGFENYPGSMATRRAIRGYESLNKFKMNNTDNNASIVGFRPVFEYKE